MSIALVEKAIAEAAVDEIISDLCDRRGLQQAWEEIDADIQDEIRDRWIELVVKGGTP